jgi:hypothetical protein
MKIKEIIDQKLSGVFHMYIFWWDYSNSPSYWESEYKCWIQYSDPRARTLQKGWRIITDEINPSEIEGAKRVKHEHYHIQWGIDPSHCPPFGAKLVKHDHITITEYQFPTLEALVKALPHLSCTHGDETCSYDGNYVEFHNGVPVRQTSGAITLSRVQGLETSYTRVLTTGYQDIDL